MWQSVDAEAGVVESIAQPKTTVHARNEVDFFEWVLQVGTADLLLLNARLFSDTEIPRLCLSVKIPVPRDDRPWCNSDSGAKFFGYSATSLDLNRGGGFRSDGIIATPQGARVPPTLPGRRLQDRRASSARATGSSRSRSAG
jgi:hypothetical protein